MAKSRTAVAGRVVAVTGGARGIGRSIAAELTGRGARVAIGDVDAEAAARTAADLGLGAGLPLDVTDHDSFAEFLDAAERELGPIDALINNAGIMPVGRFTAESDEITHRILDINVYGVMLGTKLALPRMLSRRAGHIVNIASLAGENPTPGMATYCASKQAVLGFTEAMRLEHRGTGVRFSAVLPTFTRTELIAGTRAPMGLLAEPGDVARAVAELIARPRRRVVVTRLAGILAGLNKLTPRRVGEFSSRRLGVDRIFLDEVDHAARRDYDERVRNL
ncbi:SDR family oxidoreductase [Nocardia sp. BMG51109]|uniref:SDR family oxidoreductase n=1 Tax=Nocardia sp. BMG51109 TaxID=1056816 RepID=UPI0004647D5A|nr:SDR family oxidoreductase [Nocardia sp. BMG51109]